MHTPMLLYRIFSKIIIMAYNIGLKCKQMTVFLMIYSEMHHRYAFLHDQKGLEWFLP